MHLAWFQTEIWELERVTVYRGWRSDKGGGKVRNGEAVVFSHALEGFTVGDGIIEKHFYPDRSPDAVVLGVVVGPKSLYRYRRDAPRQHNIYTPSPKIPRGDTHRPRASAPALALVIYTR